MIIKTQEDVTTAVLTEIQRSDNPRFREIMSAAVRHLHGFAREVRLTEAEFRQACDLVAQLGQLTNESHNEVVLAAGSLGLSALVCLLNNGDHGRVETTANMLGPFWRLHSPHYPNGASIAQADRTGQAQGVPIFVDAWVRDREGRPVAEALVDVWHLPAKGFTRTRILARPT